MIFLEKNIKGQYLYKYTNENFVDLFVVSENNIKDDYAIKDYLNLISDEDYDSMGYLSYTIGENKFCIFHYFKDAMIFFNDNENTKTNDFDKISEKCMFIEKFSPKNGSFIELYNFLKLNWYNADDTFNIKDDFIEISTFGWSDNETLISSLQKNFIFWSSCWEISKRGGHYTFRYL